MSHSNQDHSVGPKAEQGFAGLLSAEVAYVLAEELTAGEGTTAARRRVAPDEFQTALTTHPIKVVLDRLEASMSFDASHDWVMRPHPDLDDVSPADAVTKGCVRDVLLVIDNSFPA